MTSIQPIVSARINTIVYPSVQDEKCYFCWDTQTETHKFIETSICECKGSLKLHWHCYRLLHDSQHDNDREYLSDYNICKICMTHYTLNVDDDYFYKITATTGRFDYQTIYNLDGSLAEEGATDYQGYKHGHWKIYNDGHLVREGSYTHGLLNGLWKIYQPYILGQSAWSNVTSMKYTNELIAEGHYKSNYHHGLWKYYYPSGHLKEEGEYVYNLRHGKWAHYYESGHLHSEGTYENGKNNDDWKIYPDAISGKKRKATAPLDFEPIAKRLRSSTKK